MKNKLWMKTVLFICILFALGSIQNMNAQGMGGPGLPGFDDNVNDEAPQAPIDGFIGIALAVGAYFGAKKLGKKNNE